MTLVLTREPVTAKVAGAEGPYSLTQPCFLGPGQGPQRVPEHCGSISFNGQFSWSGTLEMCHLHGPEVAARSMAQNRRD